MNEQEKELMLWAASRSKDGKKVEAFIQSLFEGAPEGTTHLDVNDSSSSKWIRFDGGKWFYSCSGAWQLWDFRRKNEDLILRPSKQIKDLDDVTDTNAGEWIPEVGGECLAWAEKIDHENLTEAYYIGANPADEKGLYKVFVSKNGTPFTTSNFRPLKTEAEKEREVAIENLSKFMQKHSLRQIKAVASSIYDELGWRPSKESDSH